MSKLKYKYAYDESDRLIHIDDVPVEGHNDMVFTCVGCNGKMEAAIGPKRRYFRHKADESNCSKETYLHKLAKLRIKQKFDNKNIPFNIRLWGKIQCNEHCKFFTESDCSTEDAHPMINLHEHYDTCTMETKHGDFVADLLLTNSAKPNRAPIMIEVFVTHKCTDEKIDSKNKIIEVKVRSEESIDSLIKGAWVHDPWGFEQEEENDNVTVEFYNFEPKECVRPCDEFLKIGNGKTISRFVLYPGGKYWVTNIRCNDYNKRFNSASILEMNVPLTLYGFPTLEVAHYLRNTHGIEIKNCSVCRYFHQKTFGDRYCYQNPYGAVLLPPNGFYALECERFELKWLKIASLKVEDIDIVYQAKYMGIKRW